MLNASWAPETFSFSLFQPVFPIFQHAISGVFSQGTFVPDHLTVSGALEQEEKHDSQLKTNFFALVSLIKCTSSPSPDTWQG